MKGFLLKGFLLKGNRINYKFRFYANRLFINDVLDTLGPYLVHSKKNPWIMFECITVWKLQIFDTLSETNSNIRTNQLNYPERLQCDTANPVFQCLPLFLWINI